MIIFTVFNRQTGKKETVEKTSDAVVIGRLDSCDIVLDSRSVSRKHAEIVRIKNDFFIADLESGNGTFLNGKRLKPHEKNILGKKDVIRIEEFEIHPSFSGTVAKGPFEENTDSGIIEIKMIKKVLSALDTGKFPSLEGVSSPVEGKRLIFTDDLQEVVIGRDADCTFPVDSGVVSRRHAVLQKKWGGITVTDLKSKNGTFVNHGKIEEKLLKDGDVITLGNIDLVFKNPQEIDLDALSLEYEKKPEKEESGPPATRPEEPAAESVSAEAKISVGTEEEGEPSKEKPEKDRPKKDAGEILSQIEADKKKRAEKFLPREIKKQLSNFSTTELVLMGAGIVVLVSAVLALIVILI